MAGVQENSLFLAESNTLRGREGINLLVHACRSNSLSFFLPSLLIFPFLISFSHYLFFYSPICQVPISWCWCRPLYTARASFYSACRDRILLFQSLTTFVQSVCTCRPPLVCLCATPYHQTKENYFVCLSAMHPSLLWSGCLLSSYPSWHAPSGSNLALLLLGGMSSQWDTSPRRVRAGTSEQVFFLSPPPNHALLPLTHDLTVFCIS